MDEKRHSLEQYESSEKITPMQANPLKSKFSTLLICCVCMFNISLKSSKAQNAGYSLDFDGTSDFVELGDVLNNVTVPFSISAWVRVQGGGTYFLIRSEDPVSTESGNHYGIILSLQFGNQIVVHYGDGRGGGIQHRRAKRATVPRFAGDWHHVAAVVRGPTDMSVYLDGEDVGGNYEGGGQEMVHSDLPARIGLTTLYGPWWYKGRADELRIWNKDLDQDEIRANMHRVIDPAEDGLIGYWRFDEGSGQTVSDMSPFGIDGVRGADDTNASDDPTWRPSKAPIGLLTCGAGYQDWSAMWTSREATSLKGITVADFTLLNQAENSVVFGYRGEQAGYTTDAVPEGIVERWSRTWCMDYSDGSSPFNGSVHLKFDHLAADIEDPVADPALYRLLYRTDDTSPFYVVTDTTGAPLPAAMNEGEVEFLFNAVNVLANSEPVLDGDYTLAIAEFALPVELTSFTAVHDELDVFLTWETASELNNAGFEVEHLDASTAQQPGWQRVDIVEGGGTTDTPQTYTYTVSNLEPGRHDFRLKQIDFDGTFAYSDVVSVYIGSNQRYTLSEAFPNPFNPQTTFTLSVAQSQLVTIGVYDMLGRRVLSVFDGLLESEQTHRFVIDGSSLSSGTYMYRVQGESFSTSKQLVLMK